MHLNIVIIEPFSKLKSVQTCIKGDIQGFGITISEIFWNVLMNLFNKMTAEGIFDRNSKILYPEAIFTAFIEQNYKRPEIIENKIKMEIC